jgi:hypothetical protein
MMKPEQGKMKSEHMNPLNFAEHLDRREVAQLDGLAQKLQEVGLAVQEAATVLRSVAAMRAGSVLEAESRARMDAMQQELAEIKARLTERATRFQPMPEEPARAASPPPPPAAKSRRRRRSPDKGWNVSPKLLEALEDARTRHSFPHRRALVEHFLELYRRQRAGRDIIVQRLDEDEPKRGPRRRLHFRGLMPHYRQQILAEAARAEIPERLFIAGLCWWGFALLKTDEATPRGSGPEGEVHSGAC